MHDNDRSEITPQEAIEQGYLHVIAEVTKMYEQYMKDSYDSPDDFEGLTKWDVVIWLCEGLN